MHGAAPPCRHGMTAALGYPSGSVHRPWMGSRRHDAQSETGAGPRLRVGCCSRGYSRRCCWVSGSRPASRLRGSRPAPIAVTASRSPSRYASCASPATCSGSPGRSSRRTSTSRAGSSPPACRSPRRHGGCRRAQRSELGRVVYADSITLTPGTLSIDLRDGWVEVHALNEESLDALAGGLDMDGRVSRLEPEPARPRPSASEPVSSGPPASGPSRSQPPASGPSRLEPSASEPPP